MKLVNAATAAIFLSISACSGSSVPKPDEIARLVESGNVSEAAIKVREALKADPANRDLRLLNGRIALENGNYDLAISEFIELGADPALAGRVRDHLARAYLMSGKPKQALDTLGNGKPATALAYAVKAGALVLTGDATAAQALLDEGLAQFPQSPDLLVLQGDRAIADGDIDKAGDYAARAVKSAPENVQAQLLAGRVAMINREYDEANRHFDAVLAKRPQFQTALLAKASIALDRGDRKGAQAMLKQAADQLGDGAPMIAYYRAQIAYDDGKIDEANQILQGMEDVGNFPPALMLSGLVAARRGQHEQAVAALRRALDTGVEDGRARLALATSLEQLGLKDEAWATLSPLADAANAAPATLALAARYAAERGLPNASAYAARARAAEKGDPMGKQLAAADVAIRGGDWAAADRIYAGLLQANPGTGHVVLLNNAAYARLELGDAPGAVVLARRALAGAPDDPVVLDTLGWAIFKSQGATAEAADLIRRATLAMPGNQQIRRHAQVVAGARKTAGS